jgi:muconolactone delta-isomerase
VEFLVTMTTHVPDGTSDAAVEDIRAREAAHSLELAREGHLLRLWRPPLQAGEWRSLGLFGAADRAEVESVLLSMPLRVWRTDEVLELSPHPNDPGGQPREMASADGSEFLTTLTIRVPPETPSAVAGATRAEADRARELAAQGNLRRLWALAGEGRTLGLWWAGDAEEMEAILDSLPLRKWSDVETTALAPHPSDPGWNPRETDGGTWALRIDASSS